mmetsp:Transcript_97418/g.225841  ORF Transcript_97418/g.225841 Transcript_97418/m.225841 type:complete len:433 (-) Transcript_97418:173-1471(-)
MQQLRLLLPLRHRRQRLQQPLQQPVQPAGQAQTQAIAQQSSSSRSARLVRLDLVPPNAEGGRPKPPLDLPWESDAALHAPGKYTSPAVVYLGQEPEVKFGRNPKQCSVVLDSPEVPQMISRVHARLVHVEGRWVLSDEKSVNGVLVNEESLKAPCFLQTGDLICFGRHLPDHPIFEYLFEAAEELPATADAVMAEPAPTGQAPEAKSAAPAEKAASEDPEPVEPVAKRQRNTSLDVKELQAELVCSICQDWIVHANSLGCGHSFCRECVAEWLTHKQFCCPVCRSQVKCHPTSSRALDTIIHKSVEGLGKEYHDEFLRRVQEADQRTAKRQKHLTQLEESVQEAISKGKAFFHVESVWKKRERQVFEKGIKDYIGEAREVYCRLIGLTVSWIHSADERKMNQALHNLGLAREYVDKPEAEIRQRLLMFLHYG